jgi:hypothetical protein
MFTEIKLIQNPGDRKEFENRAVIPHKGYNVTQPHHCLVLEHGECPPMSDRSLRVPVCISCKPFLEYNEKLIMPELMSKLPEYKVTGKLNGYEKNLTAARYDYLARKDKGDSTFLKELSLFAIGNEVKLHQTGIVYGIIEPDLELKRAAPKIKVDSYQLEMAGGSAYLYLLTLKVNNLKMVDRRSLDGWFEAARQELLESGVQRDEVNKRLSNLKDKLFRQGPSFK